MTPLLPFDGDAAALFEHPQRRHRRFGTMDLKIAAIALSSNATLLSRNTSDFIQLAGLRVEDWSTEDCSTLRSA
jgi:tRNA(fMet)-specific endonuclease VapC